MVRSLPSIPAVFGDNYLVRLDDNYLDRLNDM
jgi:hypothetical protein